ncbi:MAG: Arabinose operon regulatory protein [Firmicutes bacterium ADurb.Bin146]|nr:MAG: Arabinose operon regulatory protein [Firmicutes bacterium ADurb.Bin146]
MTNKIQEYIIDSFQSASEDKQLLAKAIELLPYPVQIYALDGTSVMVNKAMLSEYQQQDDSQVVGKYNILKDPSIIKMGQMSKLKKVFKGETVYFKNIKVPLEYIQSRYDIEDLEIEEVYQDITLFPIFNKDNDVEFVAAFLINRAVYKGKDKIEKAKKYIEIHWQDKFDLEKIANHVDLSTSHFAKLFKKHTGITPYEHYNIYRMNKVKEKLMDTNLSVAQAFNECSIEYNGHYAKVFKDVTGYTPSEYRKRME